MKRYKRVVVKIGTKVITSKEKGLDVERIDEIMYQVEEIMRGGIDALIVTSGAIGAGMWLLGMKKRPSDLASLQAAAAVGQNYLMDRYSEFFKQYQYKVGQMLLTQEDFNDRKRYLNIKHTINALLKHKAIPIINENDTVATDEIRCGDNDRLSSLVADLCEADLLILLTDVDGLLDGDGNLVKKVAEITPQIARMGGKSTCDLGTGGMATKIEAARTVTNAGIECVIANGRTKNVLLKIMDGEDVGTVFLTKKAKFIAKKRWIAFSSRAKGMIIVDEGAKLALKKKDKSLLASGIVEVLGDFASGDVINIAAKDKNEFARGVTCYSSDDLAKIKGLKTSSFKDVLGFKGPDEVVHKDNLVIL